MLKNRCRIGKILSDPRKREASHSVAAYSDNIGPRFRSIAAAPIPEPLAAS